MLPASPSHATESRSGVLIACGGTGGHLFPGIAIAEKLIARGHPVILLISEKQIDALASKDYPHLRFEKISSRAMPKPWSPAIVPFGIGFMKSVGTTRKLIKEIGAKTVLGMGGFTSTAPLFAAKGSGCRGIIHESNAIPGRANRLNAKFAEVALVGWEACAEHFPANKVKVVGTPVRPALLNLPEQAAARERFGLMPDKFTLMIMGGSQGAKGINDATCEMLQYFDRELIQFLHITGPGEYETVRAAYAKSDVDAKVIDFCGEMEWAYAASSLIICRSGASSLTEMSVAGLPGILIPYPHAADDHQSRNAEVFTSRGASVLVRQSELAPLELAKLVAELGKDTVRLETMSQRMKQLAPLNAADKIADLIENIS